jgi:hypothetical protein
MHPASEILRANYETALEAKQAAETSGGSPEDLPGTEISEADDIFMGIPVPAEAAVPAAPPETVSAYTLGDILGLLRYLQGLAAFFPASGRRLFNEQGIGQSIKNISDALASLEKDAPQAIPKTEPAAEPEPAADVSAPAGDHVSIASLTGMLNHLEKLARDLPQTKERDILKQKVENLIEGLNAAALE